jgi:serine/threonine-protein kinase
MDKDRYFSRVHFMVEVNPPQCRLVDMGSRNGTYVNDKKVGKADLQDGDRIKAGHTIFQLAVTELEEGKTLPPEKPPASARVEGAPSAKMQVSVTPRPSQEGRNTTRPVQNLAKPADGGEIKPADVCRVCGGPLDYGASGHIVRSRVCPVCADQLNRQAQPIPGYKVLRELGQGGMGVVYQAVRDSDDMVVALKTISPTLSPSKADVERFFREARILCDLDHPHIVSFLEMGQSKNRLFFAMEFIDGQDADQLLKQKGPLPIGRAVTMMGQLLQALDYAHAKGFVHRDIKPSNLLLEHLAGRDHLKLGDFGLARVYQNSQLSGLTLTGDLGGTASFMPPEQITHYREVKPPGDLYAVAATLYRLLTNRYIYDLPGNLQMALLKVLQEDPVPIRERREDIPRALADVIHRALAKEPDKRFPNAKSMRKALLPFAK